MKSLLTNSYGGPMMNLMNNTDTVAAQLRAALKTAGFNARKVTVRHDHYSMGSTLIVTIRDASASIDAVKAVAVKFQSVSRDAYGEILGGGNTYVTVKYARGISSDDVLRADLHRLAAQVTA